MYIDPLEKALGVWATDINPASVALRIVISLVLAAVIGCERSSKRHAAGLRTFMLISLSSTAAMIMDIMLNEETASRIYVLSAAAVIGVAVMSVNCVLYSSKSQIKGLTTSAGLWTSCIIGLAAGAGLYTVTLIVFTAFICSLSIFPAFERYLKNRSNHFEVHIELTSPAYLRDFVTTIRKLGLRIDDIELNPAYANSGLSVYSIAMTISSAELKKYKTHSEIIRALGTLDYIYHIEELS